MNIRLAGFVFLTISTLTSRECWEKMLFGEGEKGISLVLASRSRRDVRGLRRMRQTYLDQIRVPNTISGSISGTAYYGQFSFDGMKGSHAVLLFQVPVLIRIMAILDAQKTVQVVFDRWATILIPMASMCSPIHLTPIWHSSHRAVIAGPVPVSMIKPVIGIHLAVLDGTQRVVIICTIMETHSRYTRWCTSSPLCSWSLLNRMSTETLMVEG